MKIVALPNAHALAHVSRLLEISRELRARGHDVLFAGRGKYLEVARGEGFTVHELPYISMEDLVEAIRAQQLWKLFPLPEIRGYIEAEVALFEAVRPDLALIDNRPTARTAADRINLPTAAVVNVHMSNDKRYPFYSLANMVGETVPGVALADRLGNAVECFFYDRLVMGGLNRLRREWGLSARYGYEHEAGDLTLYADTEAFNPVRRLPEHAHYVGPLTWHNGLPAPACLARLDPGRPRVYVSLGSESLDDLIGHLGPLTDRGMQFIVATGATEVDAGMTVPAGVYLERYINTDALLPHCDLVCCAGGNGTLYQALTHGVPVIAVTTHEEQAYGGKRVQRLGLGRTFKLKSVRKSGFSPVLDAIEQTLDDTGYRQRAQAFSQHLKGLRSAERAADLLERHGQPGQA
jgi:UDP:flavonoid glycosyltransferase YjiC (YdhE family)